MNLNPVKLIISRFLIAVFVISATILSAQEECKVLKPEISGTYTGKCKNGLAGGKGKAIGIDTYEGQFADGLPNGKGTYTWANGDIYVGEWKNGLRDGIGDFSSKVTEKDSILSGKWEKDEYLGPKPKAPQVITKTSIDRYNIYRLGDVKDRVLIDFQQNGMRNNGITNLLISSNSGTETTLGYLVGYENIIFPVEIRVSYTTHNKLRSQQYHAIFEFKIFEPGDWRVEIHN